MNRTLASFLAAAAVIGATGGTVAATTLASPPDRGSDRSSGPADTPEAPGPAGDPLLWAERTALHDGETTVPIDLIDPPVDVQRLAEGWLVNTSSDVYGTPLYESMVVTPDGTTTLLAQTLGPGDVSPDGTHYIAGTLDSYTIWDVATGDVVETVDRGWTIDAVVVESEAQAQYVDSDTVLTTWSNRSDGSIEVVLSDVGGNPGATDRQLLADDIEGYWGVSPDGRWFVARLLVTGEPAGPGDDSQGCTVLRSVDGSVDDDADCADDLDGVPSFAPDSSAVVARVGRGPRAGDVRPLPLGGAPDRSYVEVPAGTVRVVLPASDRGEVVVLARGTAGNRGGVVLVCAPRDDCREAGRADAPAAEVALGG